MLLLAALLLATPIDPAALALSVAREAPAQRATLLAEFALLCGTPRMAKQALLEAAAAVADDPTARAAVIQAATALQAWETARALLDAMRGAPALHARRSFINSLMRAGRVDDALAEARKRPEDITGLIKTSLQAGDFPTALWATLAGLLRPGAALSTRLGRFAPVWVLLGPAAHLNIVMLGREALKTTPSPVARWGRSMPARWTLREPPDIKALQADAELNARDTRTDDRLSLVDGHLQLGQTQRAEDVLSTAFARAQRAPESERHAIDWDRIAEAWLTLDNYENARGAAAEKSSESATLDLLSTIVDKAFVHEDRLDEVSSTARIHLPGCWTYSAEPEPARSTCSAEERQVRFAQKAVVADWMDRVLAQHEWTHALDLLTAVPDMFEAQGLRATMFEYLNEFAPVDAALFDTAVALQLQVDAIDFHRVALRMAATPKRLGRPCWRRCRRADGPISCCRSSGSCSKRD